ncbi:MAG: NAD-dependent epimerase/dehydratase family protein [Fusobacteriaceae bacterium]
MKKKTVMVTGSTGFIGRNFIEKYSKDYNIIPISLRKKKPEDIDFSGVDVVLHLAALVHQMKGAPEEKYFEINTELTKKLADAAKKNGIRHFVFFSTIKVYGSDGELNRKNCFNEFSECNPNDAYGKSKLIAEDYLNKIENKEFKISIVRPPLVYGLGAKGNFENLIKLINKIKILPFNYDDRKRTMVAITNLLHMTDLIIKKEATGIFIPHDEKNISIRELSLIIAKFQSKKKILVKFPCLIFKMLGKIKKNIMERLYGELVFENKTGDEKLEYFPVVTIEEEMNLIIENLDVKNCKKNNFV